MSDQNNRVVLEWFTPCGERFRLLNCYDVPSGMPFTLEKMTRDSMGAAKWDVVFRIKQQPANRLSDDAYIEPELVRVLCHAIVGQQKKTEGRF